MSKTYKIVLESVIYDKGILPLLHVNVGDMTFDIYNLDCEIFQHFVQCIKYDEACYSSFDIIELSKTLYYNKYRSMLYLNYKDGTLFYGKKDITDTGNMVMKLFNLCTNTHELHFLFNEILTIVKYFNHDKDEHITSHTDMHPLFYCEKEYENYECEVKKNSYYKDKKHIKSSYDITYFPTYKLKSARK